MDKNEDLKLITVNGTDYKWRVDEDGNRKLLTIWLNDGTVFHEVHLYHSVTSENVAEIINELIMLLTDDI